MNALLLCAALASAPADVQINLHNPDRLDVTIWVNDVEYTPGTHVLSPHHTMTLRFEWYDHNGWQMTENTYESLPGAQTIYTVTIRNPRIIY